MQNKKFDIIQCHTGTLMLVWFGGLACIFFLATKGMDAVLPHAGKTAETASLVVFALIGYGAFRWGKKASATPTQVVIDEVGITIRDCLRQESRTLLFGNIATYNHSDVNNVEELRITMKNGLRYDVTTNTLVHKGRSLGEVVAAFETAFDDYHAGETKWAAPENAANQADVTPMETAQEYMAENVGRKFRGKTFFEKPISTVILGAFTAFLLWAGWALLLSPRGGAASIFGVLGGYAVYVSAWLAARRRRSAS